MASLRIPTTLTLNGKELDPKIFRVEHLPDFTIPERDRQTIHVEGRSGDIVIDGGSYKNITRTYSVSFGASGPADFADKVSQISKWLDVEGYGELRDTYENEYYRLAFPSGAPKVSSILNGRMGKVQIDFSCVPKRFLLYGKNGFEWKYHNTESVAPFTKGDVNGDGYISLADSQLALEAAVDLVTLDGDVNTPGTAAYAADVDMDGEITAADARLILHLWDDTNHNAFTLCNPTGYDSKPVIKVQSNVVNGVCEVYISPKEGAADAEVSSVKVDLNGTGVTNFYIDCEKETVYAEGTYKNLNLQTTVTNGFPVLKAQGDSRIEFSPTVREITVFPNFWVR